MALKGNRRLLPGRPLFGASANESRWFVSDSVAAEAAAEEAEEEEVVIAVTGNTDPVNEVPLVSAEAAFRPVVLCPPLPPVLALMPLLPVATARHPGFA